MAEEIVLREPTESENLRMIHAVQHGASVAAISSALRVDLATVEAWLARWRDGKPNTPENEAQRAVAVARRAEAVKRWQSKVSTESAALAVDAFGMARDAVEQGDARGFKESTAGIATLVQLTRQAEGLDSNASGAAGASLSVYVLRVGENGVSEAKPIRNVTPEAEPEF